MTVLYRTWQRLNEKLSERWMLERVGGRLELEHRRGLMASEHGCMLTVGKMVFLHKVVPDSSLFFVCFFSWWQYRPCWFKRLNALVSHIIGTSYNNRSQWFFMSQASLAWCGRRLRSKESAFHRSCRPNGFGKKLLRMVMSFLHVPSYDLCLLCLLAHSMKSIENRMIHS